MGGYFKLKEKLKVKRNPIKLPGGFIEKKKLRQNIVAMGVFFVVMLLVLTLIPVVIYTNYSQKKHIEQKEVLWAKMAEGIQQTSNIGVAMAQVANQKAVEAEKERLRLEEEQRVEAQRKAEEATIYIVPEVNYNTNPGSRGNTSWDDMAYNCEAKGYPDPWSVNTGNGYYGGLQFDSTTWDIYGNPACAEANNCSREEQIAAAQRVPYDAWPNC